MLDKFTKWIEAKLVKTAEARSVIDFISGVVHPYGVPDSIITDNGSNFTADEVKAWCANLDIKFEAKKAIKSQAIADFVAEWIEQQQLITHKCRGSQQLSRVEYSTQIY